MPNMLPKRNAKQDGLLFDIPGIDIEKFSIEGVNFRGTHSGVVNEKPKNLKVNFDDNQVEVEEQSSRFFSDGTHFSAGGNVNANNNELRGSIWDTAAIVEPGKLGVDIN